MKRLLMLFVFFPFFFACRQNIVYNQLVAIDSLLRQELVDSALQELGTIEVDSNNAEIKAYYALLRTQAMYKSYHSITSDSVLNFSYNYYRQCGDKEKTARTLLYRGNVRLDLGKIMDAMEDYKKAEKLLDEVDDDIIKHNVFFALSFVNSSHSEYMLAIESIKKAEACALKAGRNDYLAYDYQKLSAVYYNRAKYDSSLYYINKSISAIELLPEKPAKYRAHIWTDLGVTCYMLDDLDNAKRALKKSMSIIPLGSTYVALAKISLKEKDTIRAVKQLEEGLKILDARNVDLNIINMLSQIELKLGHYQHAAELSRQAYTIKDSLAKRQQKENVRAQQIEFDRRMEAERAAVVRRWLWVGIGLAVLIGGVAVVILMRRSRLTKCLLDEEQRRVEALSEEERQVSRELNKAMSKVEQMKRARLEQERLSLSQQREWQRHEQALERGHRLFMELTGGGNTRQWTREDFKDFRIYYDTVDSAFAETVARQYGQLSPNLYLLAVLEHIGKSDDDIMAAMALTLGALRTTRSRLNQKQQDV